MTDNDNQPTASLFERCVTRREMLLTSGGALVGVLLVGCGGGGSQEPVAGSFVGDVLDPVASVAVIAGELEEGEDAREVRALIYGGFENQINEWFWGSATGNDLELSSDGGAQLEGELTSGSATGTITLPDGTSVPFEAAPATGVAGFYNVTITPDGQANGVSESGAVLEGQFGDEPEGQRQLQGPEGESSADIVPLTGVLTPPDGQPQDFEVPFLTAPAQEPDEPINARIVVSPDGTIRGGARKGSGTQFTCLLID